MSELELLQVAEQGPLTCLVIVLLAREWRQYRAELAARQAATIDDLVAAVGRLETSIAGLQAEFRAWFEQRIL